MLVTGTRGTLEKQEKPWREEQGGGGAHDQFLDSPGQIKLVPTLSKQKVVMNCWMNPYEMGVLQVDPLFSLFSRHMVI